MKFAYNQVTGSYPRNHKESFFTRLVCRPLSFPLAYILVNLGCSAWTVSVASIFAALIGCTFLCFGSVFRWIGIFFCVLWLVLDCVDGNIARVSKSYSSMGDFIDAQSGYTIMAFIFFANSVAAYHTTAYSEYSVLFLVLGSISSISNTLARLLNAKYTYCDLESKVKKHQDIKITSYDEPETKFAKIRVWIDYNLGLVGLFMPCMVVAQIFNMYDVLTILYFLYSVIGFISASVYYAIKAK